MAKKYTKILKIPEQDIDMTVYADSKEEAEELFAKELETRSIQFKKEEE